MIVIVNPAPAPPSVREELAETIAVLRDWLSLAMTDPNLAGLCASTQRRIGFLERLRSDLHQLETLH